MNVESTIRGLLASFGVELPKHLRTFEQRTTDAVARAPMLSDVIMPLLKIRTEALRQIAQLSKAMVRHAREDDACRRLMSIPGVGAVSAVTFAATIDDPARFRRSRPVGAYVGLTRDDFNLARWTMVDEFRDVATRCCELFYTRPPVAFCVARRPLAAKG